MKKLLIFTAFVALMLGISGNTAFAADGGFCQSINGESSSCN